MKRHFITAISICIPVVVSGLGMAWAQQCIAPPSGMVAWYSGDGNTNDLIAGNNGTSANGVTFAAGKVGQAFSFNGVNQFVTIPAAVIPYPGSGATGSQPLSVDAWFSTTTGGVILGQQGLASPPAAPAGAVPAIYVGTDGFLHAEVFWTGSAAPINSPVRVNDGAFHHVAVTYDGATEALYLDGVLLGSSPRTQVGYAPSYQYQLGAGFTASWPAGNGAYFYFQGSIDEVEFFNRALSPAEILAIVNAGSAGKCKTPTSGACTAPPAGMVAWYDGDGTTNDLIGGNNGSAVNGVTFAAGKVGQAFSLNGTNQFVTVPANVIPYPVLGSSGTQPLSVDAWFSTTSGGVILGQQGAVSPPGPPTGAVPAIYVGTDGVLYAQLFWKGSVAVLTSGSTKVNNGTFHHVAVTYDGANEALYLDGTLMGSMPFTQVGYAASYQYQIGTGFASFSWPAGNGGYFYFQGLIDEVQIFNRALSAAEVLAIVNAGSAGTCKPTVPVCAPLTVSSIAATPKTLWPPNGKMVPISITVSASGCGAVACKIVSVSSNQGSSKDWEITGNMTVNLRATRSGDDDSGRVYTITVQCTDSSGSAVTKTVNVTVPHDQGNGDDQGEDGNDQGDDNGNGHGHGNGHGGGNGHGNGNGGDNENE